MPLHRLDHVNLRTRQLEPMIDWYTGVLGMTLGERPDFPFPGAWLYVGDAAVVHLVAVDDEEGVGSEARLKLEHFALAASGLSDFEVRLQGMGINFRRSDIPDFNLVQINLWDPDGNHLHVDFTADE